MTTRTFSLNTLRTGLGTGTLTVVYDDAATAAAQCGTYAQDYCRFPAVQSVSLTLGGMTWSPALTSGQTAHFCTRNDPKDQVADVLAYIQVVAPAQQRFAGADQFAVSGPWVNGMAPCGLMLIWTQKKATAVGSPLPTVDWLSSTPLTGFLSFTGGGVYRDVGIGQ